MKKLTRNLLCFYLCIIMTYGELVLIFKEIPLYCAILNKIENENMKIKTSKIRFTKDILNLYRKYFIFSVKENAYVNDYILNVLLEQRNIYDNYQKI